MFYIKGKCSILCSGQIFCIKVLHFAHLILVIELSQHKNSEVALNMRIIFVLVKMTSCNFCGRF